MLLPKPSTEGHMPNFLHTAMKFEAWANALFFGHALVPLPSGHRAWYIPTRYSAKEPHKIEVLLM